MLVVGSPAVGRSTSAKSAPPAGLGQWYTAPAGVVRAERYDNTHCDTPPDLHLTHIRLALIGSGRNTPRNGFMFRFIARGIVWLCARRVGGRG